jgi:hypothetical protein
MAGDWVLGADWASLEAGLSRRLDLEGTAAASRALVRRRGIDRAATLLRLALAYGGTDLSLRGTALWAEAAGVADLSDVALMYRLQGAEAWLAGLVQALLGQDIGALAAVPGAASLQAQDWRVRLVDGTSLMAGGPGGGPGKGYHLHACFDLAAQQFDELVLTSARDAESLARHTAGPGEILVADRNFAKAAGVRAAIAQGGELIVRRGLTACRIEGEGGRPLDAAAILDWAKDGTAGGQIVDQPVWLPTAGDAPALQLRLIIQKKPPVAAEKSQKRAAKKAQRAHYEAKSKQLDAAQYLMLMTTLDEAAMPAAQVLALYRLRWQIEIAFKRLKSLADLDNIQAKEERLAKTVIWAKLILAILTETLLGHVLALSPSAQTIALAALPSPSPAP